MFRELSVMGRAKKTPKALMLAAHRELSQQQNDVLAFAERNREIEEIPAGLHSGVIQNRKRGARSDRDCIGEICELIAQGITSKTSTKFVGVPWPTWQKWLKLNHEGAKSSYDHAYQMHLDNMADDSLELVRRLEEKREAAMKVYHAAYEEWRDWKAENKDDKRPPEPIYKGPAEWELRAAEAKLKVMTTHLSLRHPGFKPKEEHEHIHRNLAGETASMKDVKSIEEAVRVYNRMLNAKPVN